MDTVKGVVQKVIRDGKHGPFAVATSDQLDGSVTFSLETTVWLESEWPEEGTMVALGDLRQKRAGWRAKKGRFWRPSDEQLQQTERSTQMIQFLYPSSLRYPFDAVCSAIVSALEDRNWQVPDISLEFQVYGSGEQIQRYVHAINGLEFRLRFGRPQGTLPGGQWNNAAAVSEICIPRKELHVFDDESGPTFYLYVGDNWERDRKKFLLGLKVNSKLRGEPKMYLEYEGQCRCRSGRESAFRDLPHTHPGVRPPLLWHTNDLGREYDPEGNEPTFFFTNSVMEEFRAYLGEFVLRYITSYPIASEKFDSFREPPAIPVPESFGELFCFGGHREAQRITQGKTDISKLRPADRYGLLGSGRRLLSLSAPNDGTVPEIAYEGFLWCGIGTVTPETPIESLEVPGHYRWPDDERFVIRVTPRQANDIYIADHALYETREREVWQAAGDRKRLTNEEVNDFDRARARSIVPISEYRGGFQKPVVLIRRELSFDEVEVVSGPHIPHYRH